MKSDGVSYMKWSLGKRVALGYGLIVLLTLCSAVSGLAIVNVMGREIQQISEQQRTEVLTALTFDQAILSLNTNYLHYIISGDEQFLEEKHQVLQRIDSLAAGEFADPEYAAKISSLHTVTLEWDAAWQEIIAARAEGSNDVYTLFRDRTRPLRDRQSELVRQSVEHGTRLANERYDLLQDVLRRDKWFIGGVAILALVLSIAIAVGFTRSVTLVLNQAVNSLALSLSNMSASISQYASGLIEQSAAIAETTATAEEVKQTVEMTAQNARSVSESAQRTRSILQDGKAAVEESTRLSQESRERMEVTAERILLLSQQSLRIGDLITTVREVSEQAHILAVNAAIEAAKAGEAGRGFAVVASEVRSLAEQSKEATVQVREILLEIQRATQSAVMAAEQGVKTSESGEAAALRAGEAIRLLADQVNEVTSAMQQIMFATEQQVAGVDQITLAMQNIQMVTAQGTAATHQQEASAREIVSLGERLKVLVSGSRLPRAEAS